MLYRIAADGLMLFHLAFIVFVVFGGLLVLKWPHLILVAPARRSRGAWRWRCSTCPAR